MHKLGLRYDDDNMHARAVGKTGIKPAEWKALLPRLKTAKRAVQTIARKGEQGFLQVPFDRKAHDQSVTLAKKISRSCSDLVVLGIGGSDLGTRALLEALEDTVPKNKRRIRVHFAGSSTDPTQLVRLLQDIDLKKTCINIVSKSGGTLEPMSAFRVLHDRLVKAIGAKKAASRIIATTDPTDGILREEAKKQKYETLSIPKNVGGRFSVLSSVGMFPAAMAGVDTAAILSGGRAAVDAFHENTASQCPACRYAGMHAFDAMKKGQSIHVTCAYSASLGSFTSWIRQLVAESLGKEVDRNGKTIHVGFTPVASIGPGDQHSQLQLWSEGPFDKLITFIEIDRFKEDIRTPAGESFTDLVHAERAATAEALRQDHRPNGTIHISELNAEGMGELILFFELATALMGELLNVNAYDQPGVELMKKLLKEGA